MCGLLTGVANPTIMEPELSKEQTANEFCSVMHIRDKYGIMVACHLADMLGFSDQDERFITPGGVDVSYFCWLIGGKGAGFKKGTWTMLGLGGWVLNDESMSGLRQDCPHIFEGGHPPCTVGAQHVEGCQP